MLNLLDLMVYAVAKERGEPPLCTGNDFATTDLVMHPASRLVGSDERLAIHQRDLVACLLTLTQRVR